MRKMQRLLHFQKFPPSTYLFHQNYKYFLNKEENSIFICYSSHLNYCSTNEKFLQETLITRLSGDLPPMKYKYDLALSVECNF